MLLSVGIIKLVTDGFSASSEFNESFPTDFFF